MITKYAEITWAVAILTLGTYECLALAFGWETLSRSVWTLDRSQYGPLVPFLAGMLMGHFFWSGN